MVSTDRGFAGLFGDRELDYIHHSVGQNFFVRLLGACRYVEEKRTGRNGLFARRLLSYLAFLVLDFEIITYRQRAGFAVADGVATGVPRN